MFMTRLPPTAQPQTQGQGDPERDGHAFLRSAVEQAVRGRLRDGLGDLELASRTLWAGMHGLVALHSSLTHDGWTDWRPIDDRIEALLDALLHGVAGTPARARGSPGARRRDS